MQSIKEKKFKGPLRQALDDQKERQVRMSKEKRARQEFGREHI